mmetsp:Transcript_48061/g.102228  ORF Transcript_48061/g.102228 Transcript_48061/m.102228 type:complete len:121 (-) Transcript_48061:5429-5791(-)
MPLICTKINPPPVYTIASMLHRSIMPNSIPIAIYRTAGFSTITCSGLCCNSISLDSKVRVGRLSGNRRNRSRLNCRISCWSRSKRISTIVLAAYWNANASRDRFVSPAKLTYKSSLALRI